MESGVADVVLWVKVRRNAMVALALSLSTVGLAGSSVAAPEPQETFLASTNFTITWEQADLRDDADRDRTGEPDSVEAILDGFEAARSALEKLGYPVELGHSSYPLYLAQSEGRGFVRAYPGESESRRSYIVVPPRLTAGVLESHVVEVFALHEFFHAVQLHLDYSEPGWLREASSTWIEDLVYDSSDSNHQALAYFTPFPELSLTSTAGESEYGAFIFLQFLAERYGGGSEPGARLIHRWWQLMAVPGTIEGAGGLDVWSALDQVLMEVGTTRPAAWAEFTNWRRHLALFEEGAAYRSLPPLAGWPTVSRADVIATESCRLASDSLPNLSGGYFSLRADASAPAGTWRLSVDGPANTSGFLRTKFRGTPASTQFLATDEAGIAQVDLPLDPAQLKRMVLGLGNASTSGPAAPLAYSLRAPGANDVVAPTPTGASSVLYGLSTSIGGSVLCGGQPAPFVSVEIVERDTVTGEEVRSVVTTDSGGRWTLRVEPDSNAAYRVEVVDPLLSSAVSIEKSVAVQVFTTIDAPATHPSVSAPYRIDGTVTPVHEGAVVSIQIRRPGRDEWREAAVTSVDGAGAYSANFRFPAAGTWEVRSVVVSTGDEDHEPGTSVTELVEVTE